MGKEQYTRLTLKELIAKKEQMLEAKKKRQTSELYIESLDAAIKVQEPSKEVVRDAVDMEDGDAYTVYQCCIEPNLKAAELKEEYGCAVPAEIVHIVFKPGEVSFIAKHCLELAGYKEGAVTPVTDLKN